MSVGYFTAFLAGILALLSPCGALLLPSFFAVTISGARRLALHAVVFFAGLITILGPLGAGAGFAGALLATHRGTIVLISGWLIVVLGTIQIFGGGLDLQRFLPQRLRTASGQKRNESMLGTYLLGMVSAVAGFCTGPILGVILTMAGASGQPLYGAALLSVYGLGMALPLFLIAGIWSVATKRGSNLQQTSRKALRGRTFSIGKLHLHTTSVITGLVLIAVGILFLRTNGLVGFEGLISTEKAFDLQLWASDVAAKIPDVAFIIAGAVVALGVWAWWAFGRGTSLVDPKKDLTEPPANAQKTADKLQD